MADTCRKDIRDLIALTWIVRPRIRSTVAVIGSQCDELSLVCYARKNGCIDWNDRLYKILINLSFGISSSSEDSEALGVEFLFLSASATVRPQRNKKKTFTELSTYVQKKH